MTANFRLCLALMICLSILSIRTTSSAQVRVTHLAHAAHSEIFNVALDELAARFQEVHPGIEVVIERAAGNYNDRLLTMIAGGAPPDVTHLVHLEAAMFFPYLADINILAERDGINLDAHIPPQALGSLQWEGMQFGLPIFGQPITITYNEDLFAERGLASPVELYRQGAWTWDGYLESARRLTRDLSGDGEPNIFGTSINNALQRWIMWVWQAGGDVFDRAVMPTEATLLQPETIQALRWYTALKLEHNVAIPGLEPFTQGIQAMNANESSWAPERFHDANFNWDVVSMPRGPVSNVTAVFMNNVQIIDASPHKPEVWEWVKFIALNPESVAHLTAVSGRSPVLRDVIPQYMELVPEPANRAIWFEELGNARTTVHSDKIGQIHGIINPAINRVLNGDEDLVLALSRAQDQINAVLHE